VLQWLSWVKRRGTAGSLRLHAEDGDGRHELWWALRVLQVTLREKESLALALALGLALMALM